MNKLGINLWNWVTELDGGCLGLPAKVAGMGFTALELPMTAPVLSDALRREVKDCGLEVTLCAAMGPGRDLSSFDAGVRASTMEYLTRCLETGASVGATLLAGPLYAGGGKRHFLSEADRRREWALAVEGLQALSLRAEGYGVRLALEPLNRYRTSVINTTDQMLALLDDIDRSNVGFHYDTYQAALEERDLLASFERALASGRMMHIHACANNRGAPGQGITPWKEILDLVVRYGYAGHLTMETFALGGLDSSWVNVQGPPDQVAAEGLAYLKGYFEKNAAPGGAAE